MSGFVRILVGGTAALLWACSSPTSSGDAGGAPRVVVADVTSPGPDAWRVLVKRLAETDAGVTERAIAEVTVPVDGTTARADGFTVRPTMLPPGEGPLYLHAVGLAAGVPVVVADGALGSGDGDAIDVPGSRYDAACDLDGDTFRDCGNLAAACCVTVAVADRPELGDCLDNPTDVPTPDAPDRKRRNAALVTPFEPAERADDYLVCDNQLDDDCAGGDVGCARTDADGDGSLGGEDCDDADPEVHPGADDPPKDGVDQDCDGQDGAGTDVDGDGWLADDPELAKLDCDDSNVGVHPGAGEVSCDGLDQDCDGTDVCLSDGEGSDLDGDGIAAPADCDDHDAGRHPGRPERCGDSVDQDCDGQELPCAADDGDHDGFGAASDCDDSEPGVHPGAAERCDDTVDQDCDGAAPGCGEVVDGDGDGWALPGDCDDLDPGVHSGAEELCNNRDDNCDGVVDEGNPRRFERDEPPHAATCGREDGACHLGPLVCAHTADGRVVDLCLGDAGTAEVCDGFDNDCDGLTDVVLGDVPLPDEGSTACGPELERGLCRRGVLYCRGGSLSECRGAVEATEELCNGADDDCDGQMDNGAGGVDLFQACYGGTDETRDVGECRVGIRRCVAGQLAACEGEVLSLPEACNGLDDDCDGTVDDDTSVPCWDFEPAKRGVGACHDGRRTCLDGALGQCEGQGAPESEICDGLDNDCDGAADTFSEVCYSGDPATLGRNRPCHPGLRSCELGVLSACVGEVTPQVELCNRQDEDCDGSPDDDFDLAGNAAHCGSCDIVCGVGEQCCGGLCAPVDTPQNCGGCGVSCGRSADGCVDLGEGAICACGAGPACPGGLRCIGGECLCGSDDDCGTEALCCDGRCEPTAAGPGGQCARCGDGGCDPALAQTCTGRTCRCGANAACQADITLCGQRNGQGDFVCQGCRSNGHCGPTERCCQDVCTPTNSDFQCEACGTACDPRRADTCAAVQAGADHDFQCVCGDTGDACEPGGATPYCIGGQCMACVADADCPADRGQCVEHVCRACDPVDQAGCGAEALCCDFTCQGTGPGGGEQCQTCGVPCDPRVANDCSARLCRCGDTAPCGGDAPSCDPLSGECVECLDDAACAGRTGRPHCVDRVCRACHPNGHEGCPPDQVCCGGEGPGDFRCETTGGGAGEQCEACDAACDGRSASECSGRACRCGAEAPCGGATPVCDDARGRCVECGADADCAGRPGGGQCIDNTCRPCDPGDHAGCAADQLCCNFQCIATGGGAGQSCEACQSACTASADTCRERDCVCGASELACGGANPLCVSGECRECRDDAQCGTDELCCGNVCQPTGGGAGQQCQACGVACSLANSNACDDRSCRCGNNAACGGGTPICDDAAGRCVECAQDADCPNDGQCVANQCRDCDPADHGGCPANRLCCNFACVATGGRANQQCSACGVACDEDASSVCTNRACLCGAGQACAGGAPICADAAGACVECAIDDHCDGAEQCVGGACRPCDPNDDAGCVANGNAPVCDAAFACRACRNDGECAHNSTGHKCKMGQCRH